MGEEAACGTASDLPRLFERIELHLQRDRGHAFGQLARTILEGEVGSRQQQRLRHVGPVEQASHVQRRVACAEPQGV